MLFVYNHARGAFVNAFENLTYDEVVGQGLYDIGWDQRLEPNEIRLPRNARDLPGYAHQAPDAPGYGFGDDWRAELRARGLIQAEERSNTPEAAIKQSTSPTCCAPVTPAAIDETAALAARMLDWKR